MEGGLYVLLMERDAPASEPRDTRDIRPWYMYPDGIQGLTKRLGWVPTSTSRRGRDLLRENGCRLGPS
jgi:hypothetical protein